MDCSQGAFEGGCTLEELLETAVCAGGCTLGGHLFSLEAA